MGYCISQGKTEFFISAGALAHVFETVRRMAMGHPLGFRWVESSRLQKASSVEAQFKEWGWPVTLDPAGDVVGISLDGEKLGDEIELFKAIAPFVKRGSFIDMHGEEGDNWRWYFDGSTCAELTPEVRYNTNQTDIIDVEAQVVSGGTSRISLGQ